MPFCVKSSALKYYNVSTIAMQISCNSKLLYCFSLFAQARDVKNNKECNKEHEIEFNFRHGYDIFNITHRSGGADFLLSCIQNYCLSL